jgi:hypothetical protein
MNRSVEGRYAWQDGEVSRGPGAAAGEAASWASPTMSLVRDWSAGADRGSHPEATHGRVRVFQHADRPTVVVATERPGAAGLIALEAIERLAKLVGRDLEAAPESLLWIEHQPSEGWLSDRFTLVRLQRGREAEVSAVASASLSRARVETLIGQALEA